MGTSNDKDIRAAADDFRPYYDAHCLDATTLYMGVRETLDRFAQKKLAVVSNKPEAFTKKILTGLGVAQHFQIVIGPESVRRQKPDPESFLKVAAEFGVEPSRICAVGDRQTDIAAGRGAGMVTVGVTYGLGNPAELAAAAPDALISALPELENFID